MNEKKKSILNSFGIQSVNPDARFVKIGKDGKEYDSGHSIVKDRVTGVNYIQNQIGNLTPLLDENGNIVVD